MIPFLVTGAYSTNEIVSRSCFKYYVLFYPSKHLLYQDSNSGFFVNNKYLLNDRSIPNYRNDI